MSAKKEMAYTSFGRKQGGECAHTPVFIWSRLQEASNLCCQIQKAGIEHSLSITYIQVLKKDKRIIKQKSSAPLQQGESTKSSDTGHTHRAQGRSSAS
jgi:hypothetical protein